MALDADFLHGSLHDALRLRFQLTHDEGELACMLVKEPVPLRQRASNELDHGLHTQIQTLYAKTGSTGHEGLLQRLQARVDGIVILGPLKWGLRITGYAVHTCHRK